MPRPFQFTPSSHHTAALVPSCCRHARNFQASDKAGWANLLSLCCPQLKMIVGTVRDRYQFALSVLVPRMNLAPQEKPKREIHSSRKGLLGAPPPSRGPPHSRGPPQVRSFPRGIAGRVPIGMVSAQQLMSPFQQFARPDVRAQAMHFQGRGFGVPVPSFMGRGLGMRGPVPGVFPPPRARVPQAMYTQLPPRPKGGKGAGILGGRPREPDVAFVRSTTSRAPHPGNRDVVRAVTPVRNPVPMVPMPVVPFKTQAETQFLLKREAEERQARLGLGREKEAERRRVQMAQQDQKDREMRAQREVLRLERERREALIKERERQQLRDRDRDRDRSRDTDRDRRDRDRAAPQSRHNDSRGASTKGYESRRGHSRERASSPERRDTGGRKRSRTRESSYDSKRRKY